MPVDLSTLCISLDTSIRDAIACIDRNQKSIVLITDEGRHLLGTISDGDVRRAILAGQNLDKTVSELLTQKTNSLYTKPIIALFGTSRAELIQTMQEKFVRQIPILDDSGRVVDMVSWEDFLPMEDLPVQAVIMAGGLGTRLRPLTEDIPKPMLPVGGKPLMEHIVDQLREIGVHKVNVTTLYKPEKIKEYFGNGKAFGIEMNYVDEDQPLGTGGFLSLLPTPQEPLLVINGDILTKVDFRAMLNFHNENQANMTVAVCQYRIQVPYGVVECDGPKINQLREKPQLNFFVNAGIYLLDPSVFEFVPNNKRFNMTDLIQWLMDAGKCVISFPVMEYWLDIGQHTDYEQAQIDMKDGRLVH